MRKIVLVGAASLLLGGGTAAFLLLRDRDTQVEAPKLPGAEWLVDERTLVNDYTKLAFLPYGDSNLAFTMWVPKGWEAKPVDATPGDIAEAETRDVPMAEILPPNSDDVILQVSYARPPGTLPMRKVLDEAAKGSTAEYLQGTRPDEFSISRATLSLETKVVGGREAGEQIIELKNPNTGLMVEWMHAIRVADRVFMVKAFCPPSKYQKLLPFFQAAGRTFTLNSRSF